VFGILKVGTILSPVPVKQRYTDFCPLSLNLLPTKLYLDNKPLLEVFEQISTSPPSSDEVKEVFGSYFSMTKIEYFWTKFAV